MQSLSCRALLLEGPVLGLLLCCLFKFWVLLDQAPWFHFSKSSAESVPGPACTEREDIHVYVLVYINQHFYNNESPFKIMLPPHPLSLPISKPSRAPYMILIMTCDGCFLVSAGLWLVVYFWSSLSCGHIQCSCVPSLYLTSRSPLFPHILLTSPLTPYWSFFYLFLLYPSTPKIGMHWGQVVPTSFLNSSGLLVFHHIYMPAVLNFIAVHVSSLFGNLIDISNLKCP